MLLEEAWGGGKGARIMCTQPRRISAVSVAERIAQERGERIGDAVGYTIRLESKCVWQPQTAERENVLLERRDNLYSGVRLRRYYLIPSHPGLHFSTQHTSGEHPDPSALQLMTRLL